MSYSLAKIDNQTVKLTVDTSYSAGAALCIKITSITPSTYVLAEVTSTVLQTSAEGYKDLGSKESYYFYPIVSTTYDIIFATDGVYRFDIMETFVVSGTTFTPTRLHFFTATSELDAAILEKTKDIICCRDQSCLCTADYCADVYDFNALTILSASYFGRPIDVAVNYGEITDGEYFINNYLYKCVVGASAIDYAFSLIDSVGTILHSSNDTIAGDYYMCVLNYAIPSAPSGGTFTAYTDETEDLLEYIADAIDRVENYLEGCDTNNPCSC